MRFLLFLIFLLLGTPAFALTDVILNDPTEMTSYDLNLVYDDAKGTLRLPTSSSSQYHIVREVFNPTRAAFQSEFLGILIGPDEKIYQRFGIPLPQQISTGATLPYSIRAPYHPSGERIDVYKGGTKLFSVDLTASRICVEDGRCELDGGENDQNCPVDCASIPAKQSLTVQPGSPTPPTITPGALPPQGSVTSAEAGSEGLLSNVLSLVFFLLGLASFGVWMYLRNRSRT